jgi:hypothetical protein
VTGCGIDIVVRGWDPPGWVDTFYPEDLPQEWRLTYFSNEFPAVLVPLSRWMAPDAERLGDWANNVHSRFRFYLELESPFSEAGIDSLDRAISVLGNRVAGLVGKGNTSRRLAVPLYFWQDQTAPDMTGISAVACTTPRPGMDLRSARAWLESFSRFLSGRCGLVVLAGDEAGAEHLHRWLQLAWILGISRA